MQHRENIEKYEGTLDELAYDIGNLKYDALARFLDLLATEFERQSKNDVEKGRKQLSATMAEAAKELRKSKKSVDRAWEISEPYM